MSVIFSHNTALEILRSVPSQSGLLVPFNGYFEMLQATSSLREMRGAIRSCPGIRQHPAHVMVDPHCSRGLKGEIRIHQTSMPIMPAGTLLSVSNNIYCAGSELTFIQMASETSLVGAVVLGYELCGGYSHFSQLISGFYDRPALTSKSAIAHVCDDLTGMRGVKRARQALELVSENSRSPMETVTACMLSLPSTVGGLGFRTPSLNYRVDLDETASRLAGASCCYLDIAWPDQRRAIEYDGAAWHQDARADRKRREALAQMGWTVNVITFEEMTSYTELLKTAALIRDVVPRDSGSDLGSPASSKLHQRLLRATRFGLGLEAALFSVPIRHGEVVYHI